MRARFWTYFTNSGLACSCNEGTSVLSTKQREYPPMEFQLVLIRQLETCMNCSPTTMAIGTLACIFDTVVFG